jgi:hypothetical protein
MCLAMANLERDRLRIAARQELGSFKFSGAKNVLYFFEDNMPSASPRFFDKLPRIDECLKER